VDGGKPLAGEIPPSAPPLFAAASFSRLHAPVAAVLKRA
jgi:hypothetical protein